MSHLPDIRLLPAARVLKEDQSISKQEHHEVNLAMGLSANNVSWEWVSTRPMHMTRNSRWLAWRRDVSI